VKEFNFEVSGERRKELANIIAEHFNTKPKYIGGSDHSYKIGEYTLSDIGVLHGEYDFNLMVALEKKVFSEVLPYTFHLITPRGTFLIRERFDSDELAQQAGFGFYFNHEGRGIYTKPNGETEHGKIFAYVGEEFEKITEETAETGATCEEKDEVVETPDDEDETADEADTGEENEIDSVIIEIPNNFTAEQLENLKRLVQSKETLIKIAFNAEELPIIITDEKLMFPWLNGGVEPEKATAYSQFICAVCDTAKRKKRVTAAPTCSDNPRFTMRTFCNSLGMIGAEFVEARKLMYSKMSGESGWRFGKPQKPDDTAESDEQNGKSEEVENDNN
jgi:hypothetical protein